MVMIKFVSKSENSSTFNFGTLAGNYEQWYQSPVGRLYDRLEKAAVRDFLPEPQSGKQLLDVGCGTGHWSRFFASCGYVVVGVDISPEMINVANSYKLNQCRFQVADACHLPFADHSFDVVAAITVLEFVSELTSVADEMVRCLRKGGKLMVGILNSLAPVNQGRIAGGKEPYVSGRLYTPTEIVNFFEPYGRVQIRIACFVPKLKGLIWFSTAIEKISLLLKRKTGAFIAVEVCP